MRPLELVIVHEQIGAGMVDDRGQLARRKPRVERDDDRAGERKRVMQRQHNVGVWREDRDAVTRANAEVDPTCRRSG